jgi:hypothetical protein
LTSAVLGCIHFLAIQNFPRILRQLQEILFPDISPGLSPPFRLPKLEAMMNILENVKNAYIFNDGKQQLVLAIRDASASEAERLLRKFPSPEMHEQILILADDEGDVQAYRVDLTIHARIEVETKPFLAPQPEKNGETFSSPYTKPNVQIIPGEHTEASAAEFVRNLYVAKADDPNWTGSPIRYVHVSHNTSMTVKKVITSCKVALTPLTEIPVKFPPQHARMMLGLVQPRFGRPVPIINGSRAVPTNSSQPVAMKAKRKSTDIILTNTDDARLIAENFALSLFSFTLLFKTPWGSTPFIVEACGGTYVTIFQEMGFSLDPQFTMEALEEILL